MPAGRVVTPLPDAPGREFQISTTLWLLALCFAIGVLVLCTGWSCGCGIVLPDETRVISYVWVRAVHLQRRLLQVGHVILDLGLLGGLCASLIWVSRRLGRMCFFC